jgi:putative PIN family toxin of toxin-antitoxin system
VEVVLDTQVVLDWLWFSDQRTHAVATALTQGQLRWIATPAMRAELAHVLPRLRARAGAPPCEHVLTQVDAHVAQWCPPAATALLKCRDPDDQKFLDLALEAGAAWLLTRDRALLTMARRAAAQGCRIVEPATWEMISGISLGR